MFCRIIYDIPIIEGLNMIVSIGTLFLAYRIYKNFDVKKTHINEQLKTVLSLVKEINETLILTKFWTKIPDWVLEKLPDNVEEKATLESWYLSLFSVGILKKEEFKDVFLSGKVIEIMPFIRYINDPLLPKTIAKSLNKFYSPLIEFSSFRNASENYVELKSLSKPKNEVDFQFPGFIEAFKSWNDFVTCSKNVQKSIIDWLKKYSSVDININSNLQVPNS